MVLTVPEVCLPIVVTEGLGDSQQPHLSICEYSAASTELERAPFPHTADGGRAAGGSERGDMDLGVHQSWFQAGKPQNGAKAEAHTVGPRMESQGSRLHFGHLCWELRDGGLGLGSPPRPSDVVTAVLIAC